MANFTVTYQTNVLIPDPKKKGEVKQLNFFTDVQAVDKEAAVWEVEQNLYMKTFIKDKGGYLRRSSTVVSFIVKDNKTEFKDITTRGNK
jgi:hypothetical protein